jgi:hypothetical protein
MRHLVILNGKSLSPETSGTTLRPASEARLINHQHKIIAGQMSDDIIAHYVAQRFDLPPVSSL